MLFYYRHNIHVYCFERGHTELIHFRKSHYIVLKDCKNTSKVNVMNQKMYKPKKCLHILPFDIDRQLSGGQYSFFKQLPVRNDREKYLVTSDNGLQLRTYNTKIGGNEITRKLIHSYSHGDILLQIIQIDKKAPFQLAYMLKTKDSLK